VAWFRIETNNCGAVSNRDQQLWRGFESRPTIVAWFRIETNICGVGLFALWLVSGLRAVSGAHEMLVSIEKPARNVGLD
jgi:hypothetical protein